MPHDNSDAQAGVAATADKGEGRAVRIRRSPHWAILAGSMAATALVVAAIAIAFSEDAPPPMPPASVVAVVDGKAYCGRLTLASDGTVVVRGLPLSRATSVVAVAACPNYRTSE